MTDPDQAAGGENVDLTPTTQTATFRSHAIGVGMTTDHYEMIKTRIRKEVRASRATSIWVALAFAFGAVFASIALALATTHLSHATNGELRVALVACGLIMFLCVVFHCVRYRDAGDRANELCDEMDLHKFDVAVPPERIEAHSTTAPGASVNAALNARRLQGVRRARLAREARRRERQREGERTAAESAGTVDDVGESLASPKPPRASAETGRQSD